MKIVKREFNATELRGFALKPHYRQRNGLEEQEEKSVPLAKININLHKNLKGSMAQDRDRSDFYFEKVAALQRTQTFSPKKRGPESTQKSWKVKKGGVLSRLQSRHPLDALFGLSGNARVDLKASHRNFVEIDNLPFSQRVSMEHEES